MKNTKAKDTEGKWRNIRIRFDTLKRLRVAKAQMELPLYDDVINTGLNLIDKEQK
jgi:hypothetical protein